MGPIGGYFELELCSKIPYYSDFLKLNSGRNCFELILKDFNPSKIYLPRYACHVLNEPIDKLDINVEFYSINSTFRPIFKKGFSIDQNELLLYTNYFGCFYHIVEELVIEYKNNLIVDNAQAFFEKPYENLATFYSPRKFFGLPDGGLLKFNLSKDYNFERDISLQRTNHLLKRIELGPHEGYQDFVINDDSISNNEIKYMSNLTTRLLENIDYKRIEKKRKKNFSILHQKLKEINEIKNFPTKRIVPLCYPLLIENGKWLKRELIKSQIFIPTYWPRLLNPEELNKFERQLHENLVCLPLDQRYDKEEMNYIIKKIK